MLYDDTIREGNYGLTKMEKQQTEISMEQEGHVALGLMPSVVGKKRYHVTCCILRYFFLRSFSSLLPTSLHEI